MLWDVALVPEAVLRGKDTHDAIGEYIGAKGQRQGLDDTQAARVLGSSSEPTPEGRIELTTYGRAFAQYDRNSQRNAMRRLLRRARADALGDRDAEGQLRHDWNDIARVLQGLAPLVDSTAQRRARTAAARLGGRRTRAAAGRPPALPLAPRAHWRPHARVARGPAHTYRGRDQAVVAPSAHRSVPGLLVHHIAQLLARQKAPQVVQEDCHGPARRRPG